MGSITHPHFHIWTEIHAHFPHLCPKRHTHSSFFGLKCAYFLIWTQWHAHISLCTYITLYGHKTCPHFHLQSCTHIQICFNFSYMGLMTHPHFQILTKTMSTFPSMVLIACLLIAAPISLYVSSMTCLNFYIWTQRHTHKRHVYSELLTFSLNMGSMACPHFHICTKETPTFPTTVLNACCTELVSFPYMGSVTHPHSHIRAQRKTNMPS